MRIDFLKTLIVLKETRSVHAAAKRLNYSKANVYYHLRCLESIFNCAITTRESSNQILTPNGEKIASTARRIVKMIDELQREIKE